MGGWFGESREWMNGLARVDGWVGFGVDRWVEGSLMDE